MVAEADTNGPFELLRRADTPMYAARANGKGGSQAYESSLDEGRILRRQIEREIASRLGRNGLDVVHQPLVDAQGFTTVGVEALVRSPGRPAGPLKPEKFIGIAKGSGLIQAPGMYVLGPVCRETRDIEGLCISVNVPPVRFSHQDFERQVRLGLDNAGLAPERLQLEITERQLIDYTDRARRAIGAGFARDDFGSGFTSLAYLQFYGFTCIKINRSLTKRVQPNRRPVTGSPASSNWQRALTCASWPKVSRANGLRKCLSWLAATSCRDIISDGPPARRKPSTWPCARNRKSRWPDPPGRR